jgi:opacity protein-like surface antigen
MNHGSTRRAFLLAGVAALAFATPAQGQGGGKGFLFQEPRWTLAIRGGFDRANANSDVFEFVTDELTLERKDFSGYNVGADLAFSVVPRIDVVVGATRSASTADSESRKYIGTDDLPILQTTTFVRMAFTGGVKAYLLPRGQTVGSLAWIPSRFSPYVGAGGGVMRYKFEQEGEFVDANSPNLDIFRDKLTSDDWTPTAHGLAGLDFSLTPHLGVTTEARYSWARGEMGNGLDADFLNFGRIDLSGWSATMGLHVRF